MFGLVQVEERPRRELLRSWNLFFSDGDRAGLWRFVTRPGFRHVEAAAYFADQDRWVFVIPSRDRLLVAVKRVEESAPIYDAMFARASVVLRVEGREGRSAMPASVGCVGAMKALLGIRSRALTPFGLLRHLRANGAEILHVRTIREDPAAAAGRPGSEAHARPGAAAG